MNTQSILGQTDTAAYTFVAVAGVREIEKTISAPDQNTAYKEFWALLTDSEKNAVESIECVEIERF